jgi:YidC/Oxa1 family membrane protein insertase
VQLLIQMPILLALYRVFYNIPAYVPMIKQVFFPLVDKLREVDPTGTYLQSTNAARYFTKQFENENFVNGVTEYVQNTFIDVLNKFNSADWTALSEHFTDLQSDISTTVSNLTRYNNFLGLNMANSPSSLFREAISNKTYVLCIVALIIPVLAALTQYLNVALMPQADNGSNDQMAQQMKTMNIMMPLMSAFFCWSLPNGMGLYWIAGAVIRCIQQVVINKQIDKMDIDAMVEKNLEKMKEKEAKEGKKDKNRVSSSTMNTYSSMNTRRMKDRTDTNVSADSEKKVQQARQTNGKKYKAGSLAEKANMVSSFNDSNRGSNKKQGKKG